MFMIPAFILGAIIGWFRARRFGGNRLDQMQYAFAHGMALALLALLATILADWAGWA